MDQLTIKQQCDYVNTNSYELAYNVTKTRDHNSNGYLTITTDVYDKLPINSINNMKKIQHLPNFSFYAGLVENYMTMHTITAMDMDHEQYADYIDSKAITPYNLEKKYLSSFMYTAYVIMYHHISNSIGCDDLFKMHLDQLKHYKKPNYDVRILKYNDYNIAIQKFKSGGNQERNQQIIDHIQYLFESKYAEYTYNYCDKMVSPFIDRYLYKSRIQKMPKSYIMFDLINSEELVWNAYRHVIVPYSKLSSQCLRDLANMQFMDSKRMWDELWVEIDDNPIRQALVISEKEQSASQQIIQHMDRVLETIAEIDSACESSDDDDDDATKLAQIFNGLAVEEKDIVKHNASMSVAVVDMKLEEPEYEVNISNQSNSDEDGTYTIATTRWRKALDAVVNNERITLPLQKVTVDRPYMHHFDNQIYYDPGNTINYKFRGDYMFSLYVEGGIIIKRMGVNTNQATFVYINDDYVLVYYGTVVQVHTRTRLIWIKTKKKEAVQYVKMKNNAKHRERNFAYTNSPIPLIIDIDILDQVSKNSKASVAMDMLNAIFSNLIPV